MRFKVDENLPVEVAALLRHAGFTAHTVGEEHLLGADDSVLARRAKSEQPILVTLDLDFANIRAYPPPEHAGIVVLRAKRQDKATVLALLRRAILVLANRAPTGELWIVEADRIRIRAG